MKKTFKVTAVYTAHECDDWYTTSEEKELLRQKLQQCEDGPVTIASLKVELVKDPVRKSRRPKLTSRRKARR